MAIRDVVTRGFGNGVFTGSVAMMVTRGYAIGAAACPAITLKALLILGGTRDEGQLVKAVAEPWFDIIRMIEQDPCSIYQLRPRQMEQLIAGAYERAGFDEVILTPHGGDKGRDVIAVKRGIGCVRFIDQVKAYKPRRVVTADEVGSMLGTVLAEPNVSKGIITTTGKFAPRLFDDEKIKANVPYRIELKDLDSLLKWLNSLRQS